MTVMRAIGLCLGLLMLISQVHAVYTEAFFWVQGVICVSVGVMTKMCKPHSHRDHSSPPRLCLGTAAESERLLKEPSR